MRHSPSSSAAANLNGNSTRQLQRLGDRAAGAFCPVSNRLITGEAAASAAIVEAPQQRLQHVQEGAGQRPLVLAGPGRSTRGRKPGCGPWRCRPVARRGRGRTPSRGGWFSYTGGLQLSQDTAGGLHPHIGDTAESGRAGRTGPELGEALDCPDRVSQSTGRMFMARLHRRALACRSGLASGAGG